MPNENRDLIQSYRNPALTLDYVSSLTGQIGKGDGSDMSVIKIEVRYVPDKLVLEVASFESYLGSCLILASEELEKLASVILEDLNNEIVPRWLHVTASTGTNDTGDQMIRHSVSFEDRQPDWDNPSLLARLNAI